jgi:hypothetical protein
MRGTAKGEQQSEGRSDRQASNPQSGRLATEKRAGGYATGWQSRVGRLLQQDSDLLKKSECHGGGAICAVPWNTWQPCVSWDVTFVWDPGRTGIYQDFILGSGSWKDFSWTSGAKSIGWGAQNCRPRRAQFGGGRKKTVRPADSDLEKLRLYSETP